MNRHPLLLRIASVLALLVIVLAAYWFVARPYQLNWGATQEELTRPMPGDELDPNPTFLATRAITIDAAPETIWPWLIQMGYDRAGFYGYDILENQGSKTGLVSADHIIPAFQNFKVGDPVPISSVARTAFYAIEPNRCLIWSTGPGAGGFTWALYPIDTQRTRLVSRIRWTHHWDRFDLFSLDLFTDFTDHIAVRRVLQGVRDRAEGRAQPLELGTAEFGVYVLSALIWVAGILVMLMRPLTWQNWLAGLATGSGWLIVWYGPMPIWAGALLELALVAGLLVSFRRQPIERNLESQ